MFELLKPFWLIICKWGLIIGGVFLVLLKIRESGKNQVKQDNLEKSLNAVLERNRIENDLNNLSDDKLNKLYSNEIKRD